MESKDTSWPFASKTWSSLAPESAASSGKVAMIAEGKESDGSRPEESEMYFDPSSVGMTHIDSITSIALLSPRYDIRAYTLRGTVQNTDEFQIDTSLT